MENAGESGIKVILGTPTYSIPAWLWYKHPSIAGVSERGKGLKVVSAIRKHELSECYKRFKTDRLNKNT